MGDYSPKLAAGYFDFVVSVSVVEHVPLDSINAFFGDCARVLKPGGRMIHAIDTYLFDPRDGSLAHVFQERIQAYLSLAERPDLGIKLVEKPRIDKDVRFSCRYATVPDNVLHEWNLKRPSNKRAIGQVVSIKSEWIKTM
jgi:SAM-dependent methyltransferase